MPKMNSLLPWPMLRMRRGFPQCQTKRATITSQATGGPPVRKVRLWPASKHSSDMEAIPTRQDSDVIGKTRHSIPGRPSPNRVRSIMKEQLTNGELFDKLSGRAFVDPRTLREACKCSKCVDLSDKQRNFRFTDIPRTVEVERYTVDGDGTYTVHWKNDVAGFEDHVSRYARGDLVRLSHRFPSPEWSIFQRPIKLWDRSKFQTADSTVPFQNYMSESRTLARVLHLLWRDGLVFIDGVPEIESAVSEIAQRIGPLRNTFYGNTWDVRSVPQAKNVAYTSKHLGFHMDLLYMKEPPGFQLLHCLQNTCSGGESRFADTINAADGLISSSGPTAFDTLVETFVVYEYLNDGYFYSDSKPIFAPEPAHSQPTRSFLNAKNPRKLSQLRRVYWSPPFVGTALDQYSSSDLSKALEVADKFATSLDSPESVIETKLPPGTCAIFDNLRVVHARDAFDVNSGSRWLRGAYVDFQDFYSKALTLADEMPAAEGY